MFLNCLYELKTKICLIFLVNIEDFILSSSAKSVVVALCLMILNEFGHAFDVIGIYIKNIYYLLLVSLEKYW